MFAWLIGLFVEAFHMLDVYFLHFVKDLTLYVVRKAINILGEYSRIPFHLVVSAVEMVSFGLFIGYPAFRLSRRMYRSDPHIRKTIAYGVKDQQTLDVYYLPNQPPKTQAPVVLFIQGGGWTVCKKDFYATLGAALRKRGIMTVVPNYMAFPKGDVPSMIDDVRLCIAWTIANIAEYGGNPNRIILVGQSAGAHLAAMAFLTELEEHFAANGSILPRNLLAAHANGNGDMGKSRSSPSLATMQNAVEWKFAGIKHLMLVSGPYHVPQLFRNMEHAGKAHISGLADIFGGKENFIKCSPVFLLRKLISTRPVLEVSLLVPPVTLVQGTNDKTIPMSCVQEMETALRQAGVHGKTIIYEGHSHLESIMEVLEGFDNARMLLDLVKIVNTGTIVESHEQNKSWWWRARAHLMRVLSPV